MYLASVGKDISFLTQAILATNFQDQVFNAICTSWSSIAHNHACFVQMAITDARRLYRNGSCNLLHWQNVEVVLPCSCLFCSPRFEASLIKTTITRVNSVFSLYFFIDLVQCLWHKSWAVPTNCSFPLTHRHTICCSR